VGPFLRIWEVGITISFAFDDMHRRVLIGLTDIETLEFLRLRALVYDRNPSNAERHRHAALRASSMTPGERHGVITRNVRRQAR
jgi:hypothetical protein